MVAKKENAFSPCVRVDFQMENAFLPCVKMVAKDGKRIFTLRESQFPNGKCIFTLRENGGEKRKYMFTLRESRFPNGKCIFTIIKIIYTGTMSFPEIWKTHLPRYNDLSRNLEDPSTPVQ